MKTKKTLALLLALAMVLSLAACGSSSSSSSSAATESSASSDAASTDSEVLTIGVIGPMTGSIASYGTNTQKGAQLAADEINAAGGLTVGDKTYTIELEVKDDQFDTTECMNGFNALVADGVQLIIGPSTSGCAAAVTSIANSEHVVMITPTATADSLCTEMDYVFRCCFKDSFQGQIAASYASKHELTKVGVVYAASDTYSSGLAEAFISSAEELGLEVVAAESIATISDVEYTNQFTKMVTEGAELVFCPLYYDVLGPYLVPQARSVGYDGIILAGDGADGTLDVIPEGSDLSAYNNFYNTGFYHVDLAETDLAANFIASFEAAYGETPNAFAALGYSCMLVLTQACQAAGAVDGESVQAAMADTSTTYDVVTGSFHFDETGTPVTSVALVGYKYEEGDEAVSTYGAELLTVD